MKRLLFLILVAYSVCPAAGPDTNTYHLTFAWDPVPGITNYQVFRITNGAYLLAASTSQTNVTVSNLPPGQLEFVVASVSNGVLSEFSRKAPWKIYTFTFQTSSNLAGPWMDHPLKLEYLDPTNPAALALIRIRGSNWLARPGKD